MKTTTILACSLCLATGVVGAQSGSGTSGLQPPEQELQQAALDGNTDAVKRLVAGGTRIDAVDSDGHTALMWAAFNGHTPVVRYLLDEGAKLQAKDRFDRTPLMYASSGPNDETIKLLLSKGASPNLQDKPERFTPLMFAAAEGQMKIVLLLLEHGADPGTKDADGDTAESMAAKNGHSAVVEVLKQAKVPGVRPPDGAP
jgi:ankyrin repeat protein